MLASLIAFGPLADVSTIVAPTYYVGWPTLALINAGLAQSKGRSGLLWFLLSLVMGPIATLVIVLLSKTRAQ